MSDLTKILEFVRLTHLFQNVERTIFATGTDKNENDAEHSFQLALLAWYIIESKGLNLEITKVMKYALAHDLVEAYAGDTFSYTKDTSRVDSKIERESDAAKRIKKEFPEFHELHVIIQQYEERADKESRFIYSLDKVIPMLNIYADGGRTWRRDKISYRTIRDTKDSKITLDKDVEKIWLELTKLLEKHHDDLFPRDPEV